jgi:hypothetical protein
MVKAPWESKLATAKSITWNQVDGNRVVREPNPRGEPKFRE